jgi:hypothetical protein
MDGKAARVAETEAGPRESKSRRMRTCASTNQSGSGAGVQSLSSRAGIGIGLNIKQARCSRGCLLANGADGSRAT